MSYFSRLMPVLLISSSTLSMADEALDERDSSSINSYFTVGEEVVVLGTRNTSKNILSSVDILSESEIKDQSVESSWELFSRLPGVTLTRFNQGNISGEFAIRGFNGEGEINAVKLLIDGIPSNSNSGNMEFIDSVSPLEIDSIELVRGTNDPRYGLHNIAGNANINTRIGDNYKKAQISYGSYGTLDAQFAAGIEEGDFSQNYSFAYRESDNYRDHADQDKLSFSGKWFHEPTDKDYRVGLIARWFQSEADSAGYLSRADAETSPRMSNDFNDTDGGERDLGQLSGHLDYDINPDLTVNLKVYGTLQDETRWVRFADIWSQQERITDEKQYGAIATAIYNPTVPWAEDLVIEAGTDIQKQDIKSVRYRTEDRQRTAMIRNQDFDLLIYGGYVQATVQPTSMFKLVPAIRFDTVDGSFRNLLDSGSSELDAKDYGVIWQPKFSAVFTPIDDLNIYGNWGRTFQVGIGAATFDDGLASSYEPSINDGWEVGAKWQINSWLGARIAYWEQTATAEERKLFDASSDSETIGETRREGYDVQVNVRPSDELYLWLSYSDQKGIIESSGSTNDGNEINHIPSYLFSGGVSYQFAPNISTNLSFNSQDDYFINKENDTDMFGGYFLLNFDLQYNLNENTKIGFQVSNVTDEDIEYVWDLGGGESLHAPGNPRTYSVSVAFDF